MTDTYTDNGTELVLTETTGTPGFTYDFRFGDDQSVPDTHLIAHFKAWYDGNLGHNVKLQQFNYNTLGWTNVTADAQDFPDAGSEQTYQFTLIDNPNYISGGKITPIDPRD